MIHSDLPWSMCGEGECKCGSIFAGDGEVQVGCLYGPDDIGRGVVPNAEARRGNAALLLKAVNLHDELVAALEAQKAYDDHYALCLKCEDAYMCGEGVDLYTKAQTLRNAALTKAKGE